MALSKLAANSLDLTDNYALTGTVTGTGNVTLTDLQNGTLNIATTIPGTTNLTLADLIVTNLTVNGTFTVLGTQSIINTETLKVEDSLIEVGLVNSGGSLVAPSSDANIDVGMIFHYYSGSAKKAAVFWDDSVGRIAFGADVSESSSVLTNTTHATIEAGGVFIKDAAGLSAVISHDGSLRQLENITVDGGSF